MERIINDITNHLIVRPFENHVSFNPAVTNVKDFDTVHIKFEGKRSPKSGSYLVNICNADAGLLLLL